MIREKKIYVKYYVNTQLKPVLINDKKYYPVYLKVIFNKNANSYKVTDNGESVYAASDDEMKIPRAFEVSRIEQVIRFESDLRGESYNLDGFNNRLEFYDKNLYLTLKLYNQVEDYILEKIQGKDKIMARYMNGGVRLSENVEKVILHEKQIVPVSKIILDLYKGIFPYIDNHQNTMEIAAIRTADFVLAMLCKEHYDLCVADWLFNKTYQVEYKNILPTLFNVVDELRRDKDNAKKSMELLEDSKDLIDDILKIVNGNLSNLIKKLF